MTVTYKLMKHGSGVKFGPFIHADVVGYISSGEFNQNDLVSCLDGPWQSLKLCKDFYDVKSVSKNTVMGLCIIPFTGFFGIQYIYLKNYWAFAAQLFFTLQCLSFYNPSFFEELPLVHYPINFFFNIISDHGYKGYKNLAGLMFAANFIGLVIQVVYFGTMNPHDFNNKYTVSKERFTVEEAPEQTEELFA